MPSWEEYFATNPEGVAVSFTYKDGSTIRHEVIIIIITPVDTNSAKVTSKEGDQLSGLRGDANFTLATESEHFKMSAKLKTNQGTPVFLEGYSVQEQDVGIALYGHVWFNASEPGEATDRGGYGGGNQSV